MVKQIDRFLPLSVRAAALMPAAVLAVHQLRYQLAFGGETQSKLASEGHQYLGALAPIAAMFLAIGIGLFLARLSRVWSRGSVESPERARATFSKVWLVASISLLAIYCGQELLEGLLASGHPGGILGVFGEGGLWAVPLSGLLGAVVAGGLRVAEAAVEWVAAKHERRRHPRKPPRRSIRPADAFLAVLQPLPSAAAGRAPPPLACLTF